MVSKKPPKNFRFSTPYHSGSARLDPVTRSWSFCGSGVVNIETWERAAWCYLGVFDSDAWRWSTGHMTANSLLSKNRFNPPLSSLKKSEAPHLGVLRPCFKNTLSDRGFAFALCFLPLVFTAFSSHANMLRWINFPHAVKSGLFFHPECN